MEFHLLLQSSVPAPELVFSFLRSLSSVLLNILVQRKCYSKPSLFIVELSFFLLDYNERLDFEETAK